MPKVNVYRDIDAEGRLVETITLAERDVRVATMENVDVEGMASPYAYRDSDGTVWGFAEALTDDEIAEVFPPIARSPEERASIDADLQPLLDMLRIS